MNTPSKPLNIKQAASLAGVSRSTLYRSYINNGRLSVTDDDYGKPAIQLVELLRVFPHIKLHDSEHNKTQSDISNHEETASENGLLALELKKTREMLQMREEQLREASAREEKMLEIMINLQRQIAQERSTEPKNPWWKFWS